LRCKKCSKIATELGFARINIAIAAMNVVAF
jgi:hypothetical protein